MRVEQPGRQGRATHVGLGVGEGDFLHLAVPTGQVDLQQTQRPPGLAQRWRSARDGIWLMAYSARAVMVRLGLMPGLAGMTEPSTTYSPGYWCTWKSSPITPSFSSRPKVHPPRGWAVMGTPSRLSASDTEGDPPTCWENSRRMRWPSSVLTGMRCC